VVLLISSDYEKNSSMQKRFNAGREKRVDYKADEFSYSSFGGKKEKLLCMKCVWTTKAKNRVSD